MQFRVWGKIDGVAFSETFGSVAEWRSERKIIEAVAKLVVLGMASA